MSNRLEYFKLTILATLLVLGLSRSQYTESSPLYGGDKPNVAREFQPKQVQLATGTAECVRTAWIGDIRNRTVICVEWRMIRREGR